MKTDEQIAAYVFSERDKYKEKQKKRRAVILKAVPAAALSVIAVGAVFLSLDPGISVGRGKSGGLASGASRPTTSQATYAETAPGAAYIQMDSDTGMEKGWDEKPLYEKFRVLTYNGKEYDCRKFSGSSSGIIPESKVGEKLSDITISTVETFSRQEFSVNAEIFAVNGVAPDAAAAVKYEGTDEYYAFVTRDYFPKDLGGMQDALDLLNNISFGEIYIEQEYSGDSRIWYAYDPITVDGEKAEIIKRFLEECRDVKCETDDDADFSRRRFGIQTSVSLLGVDDRSIWFTENGYMATNIMEWGFYFNVGEERINKLADALGVTAATPFVSTVFEQAPLTSAADEGPADTVIMYTQPEAVTAAENEKPVETEIMYTQSAANIVTRPD